MIAWLGPILALLGVLLGAYFTRSRENEKARRDKRSQVYAKYLEVSSASSTPTMMIVQGKLATGQPLTESEMAAFQENRVSFINAHANIVVYGSRSVITALSGFYDVAAAAKGDIQNPEMNAALIRLITAMRADSDAEDYPEFGAHVDNIIGAKANARAMGG